MGSDALRISEQALAVLREVAARRDATLLRVPARKTLAAFRAEAFGSGRATAGLAAAERELLEVHRLEVAWLLREAARRMLIEGEQGRRYVVVDERLEHSLTPGEIEARAGRGGEELEDPELRAPLAWLRAFGSWPVFSAASVREIAAAAHRLEPTNTTRFVVAADLIVGDQPRAALPLLRQILELAPTLAEEALAREYAGFVHARLGDHSRACDVLASLCMDPLFSAVGAMTRLISALSTGQDLELRSTAAALDRRLSADEPIVRAFVSKLRDQQESGHWQPDARAREGAVRHPDITGAGRSILDAIR